MSALAPKADIARRRLDVRFVPDADIALSLGNVRHADNRRRRKYVCSGGPSPARDQPSASSSAPSIA
jgi:hypothetical protein